MPDAPTRPPAGKSRARPAFGAALVCAVLGLLWVTFGPTTAPERVEAAVTPTRPTPARPVRPAPPPETPDRPASPRDRGARFLVGIGDRVSLPRGDDWWPLVDELDRRALAVDLLEIWLPRGWTEEWVTPERLRQIVDRGITPVFVHYFFGDDISAETVQRERGDWRASLSRMARLIRMDEPVLVVLEPEWNVEAPPGETAVKAWPRFSEELRSAAALVREQAPNALVGTCPGDFEGTPDLERVLGPVAGDLDFLGFQEMRAATRVPAGDAAYTKVADAAVDYARYLKRAFNRPLLLGYVAVSSYDGWEGVQESALRGLVRRRRDLRDAGVFGLVYFQLVDDPAHTGYFGPAERHFGLVRADGTEKPALAAFRDLLD